MLLSVPYSEHSSWNDLRACVKALRPAKIVPTVNAHDATAAAAIVDRFADLMDLSRHRGRMDRYLIKGKQQQQEGEDKEQLEVGKEVKQLEEPPPQQQEQPKGEDKEQLEVGEEVKHWHQQEEGLSRVGEEGSWSKRVGSLLGMGEGERQLQWADLGSQQQLLEEEEEGGDEQHQEQQQWEELENQERLFEEEQEEEYWQQHHQHQQQYLEQKQEPRKLEGWQKQLPGGQQEGQHQQGQCHVSRQQQQQQEGHQEGQCEMSLERRESTVSTAGNGRGRCGSYSVGGQSCGSKKSQPPMGREQSNACCYAEGGHTQGDLLGSNDQRLGCIAWEQQQAQHSQHGKGQLFSASSAVVTAGGNSSDVSGESDQTAVAGADVDLSEVDVAEQQQLWEELVRQRERQQRLKRSLELQKDAKKRQRSKKGLIVWT
jgi:hypothetical protein